MTGSQLSGLGGLEEWLTVVRAERDRANLGMTISRPTWKNLVFTGAPGTGKSHVARAVASAYHELGFLKGGQVVEVAAAGMSGWTVRETRQLVNEAIARAMGRVLMITGVQARRDMRDGGVVALSGLYEEMTAARHDLVVVLSGEAGPSGELLAVHRPLAARFAAVVAFPGYEPADLDAVFARLAGEAGFTLGDGARPFPAPPGRGGGTQGPAGPGPSMRSGSSPRCWPTSPPRTAGAQARTPAPGPSWSAAGTRRPCCCAAGRRRS